MSGSLGSGWPAWVVRDLAILMVLGRPWALKVWSPRILRESFQGLGLRVEGLGFGVLSLGFWVEDLGFRAWDLGLRVWGLGTFRV